MNKEGHVLNAALLSVGLGVILTVSPGVEPTLAVARDAAVTLAQITIPVVLGALLPDVDTAFGRHRKTLHNVFVLGLFLGFPVYFDNLHYVWIGVATHLVLDYFGSRRGIALFYPLSESEYDFPTGVTTSSKWANPVTVLITAVELGVLAAVHFYAVSLNVDVRTAIGTVPLG
jgi:hypothetical protein